MRKFFIVIPTKNRCATLKESIKTALAQSYDNLEVIVSDNYSTDDTKAVVECFNDPRLRYQKSGKSLAMVNSWEFALSAVEDEGYVHFMGDDNGLLPNAIETVNRLIDLTGSSIVHGDVVQYKWPGLDGVLGEIAIPIARGAFIIDAKKALINAYRLRIGFSRLPTINVAFVHTSVISEVRKVNGGRYFCASNPDVYSALLNSFCVEKYCYSKKPFVVNGASSFSNGGTTQKAKGVSAFVKDNLSDGYVYHRGFPPSASYYLNVYEAYAIAAEKFSLAGFQISLPMSRLCALLIKDELIGKNRFWLIDDVENFARLNSLKLRLPNLSTANARSCSVKELNEKYVFDGDSFVFFSSNKLLATVYNASNLAHFFMECDPELKLTSILKFFLAKLKWKLRAFFMGAKALEAS